MAGKNNQGALLLGALVALLFLFRRRGVEAAPYTPVPPRSEWPEIPPPVIPGTPPPGFVWGEGEGWVRIEEEPVIPPPVIPPAGTWAPPPGTVYVEGEGWVRIDETFPPSVWVPVIPPPVIPETGIETPTIPTSTQVIAPGSALPGIEELIAQRMRELEEAGY